MGALFKPDNMRFGALGAGNNWAKGHFTEGAALIDEAVDIFRRETDSSSCQQGIQLAQSPRRLLILEQSYELPDGEVIIIGLYLSYYGLIEAPAARAKPVTPRVTHTMDNVDKSAHLVKLYHIDGLATIFSEQSVAISSSLLLRFCGVTAFRRICNTATKREIELCVC